MPSSKMTPEQLLNYLAEPRLPETNFSLGYWYEFRGHYSPALSFYIRTAEFSEEQGTELVTNLGYEALLRAHLCVDRFRTREYTSKSLLQRAIALNPSRPEAYFLMVLLEFRSQNWIEVYTLCSVGFKLEASEVLNTSVGYVRPESFLYYMSIASRNLGRVVECRKILQELVSNHRDLLTQEQVDEVGKLLPRWGVGPAEIADVPYVRNEHLTSIKRWFDGIETVERNFSQCYQDMFVLTMLNGRRNGTYIEIGSEDPEYKSNTALLERGFDWKGISVEIDAPEAEKFSVVRSNPVINADARTLDYESVFDKAGMPLDMDYLQIDTEPSSVSMEVLLSMPLHKYRFAVITFEHDYAVDITRSYREKSRRYLESLGYVLVVPDIGPTDWYSFEDWWVHPELVDSERLLKLRREGTPSSGANDVRDYFFGLK